MKPENICPECRKVYDKKPIRCICGWYMTSEVKSSIDKTRCHFIINGQQCNEPGSVAYSVRGNDWFCGEHASFLRDQRYNR